MDQTPRMLLLTAIANPMTLDEFLPSVVGRVYYPDHANFDYESVKKALEDHQATSLLVTTKDWVKLEKFDLPLSILSLRLEVGEEIMIAIKKYIKEQKC